MIQTAVQPATAAISAMGAIPDPYGYLCLDLETADASPDEVEAWARREWSPSPSWKAETIGTRWLEALAKKKERAALLDSSPIICVGLRSDTELRCLHCMQQHPPRQEHGGLVEGFADLPSLLIALRNVLDALCGPDTVICGHNIIHFDMAKLRWAYVHEGVHIPDALLSREQPVFDTMREYHRYSLDGEQMVSLDGALERFGLPSHKAVADGSKVPELYRTGQYGTIVQYQLLDVLAESQLYLRMTGQAEGLR
jgi:hypothetical protein